MASDANNASVKSRLLVWPRRRRRPREETGFVLGWRSKNPSHRETVVCAGIMSPNTSYEQYRRRLSHLKDHESEMKPKICCCLTESLDIVAVWTSKPGVQLSEDSSSVGDLPIITQHHRGYPWYQDDGKISALLHKQVVFYDPPSSTNTYAHLESEYGHGDACHEWSLTIHQLNHARELAQMMQAGEIPSTNVIASDIGLRSKKKKVVDTSAISVEKIAWWRQLFDVLIGSSMTFLHFQQLYDKEKRTVSWLSCISLARCLQSLPESPGKTIEEKSIHTCHRCSRVSMFPSRSKGARDYVARWDRYIFTTLDLSLGMGAAFLLFMAWRYASPQTSPWAYYTSVRRGSFESLENAISWLEDSPAGFKLNVSLTKKMGQAIRKLMNLQRGLLEATLWNSDYGHSIVLPFLLIFSGACGWTGLLAVLVDLWRLETLHLWVLVTSFRYMYITELFLLSALFRLFRGKKRNVLRQRTDSMQYDAMQLLVGTIGFCICIFLWTTMMVYYSFFVISNLIFNLPVLGLWMLYIFSRAIPWGSLGWRLFRPHWFSKAIYLDFLSNDDNAMQVAALCSVSESPVKILLSGLSVHFMPVLQWLFSTAFEVIYPRSYNKSPSSLPLAILMQNYEG